jgi:hypothetical protein
MINFGKIYNGFNELMLESFISKDTNKKDIFNKYLKSVKSDKVLKTQYSIYNSISEKYETNDIKIGEFIKETLSLMDKYSIKDIKESEAKLLSLIPENSKYIDREYKLNVLHENIGNLIIANKTKSVKNIDSIVESFNYVFNYIKNNVTEEKSEPVNENVVRLAMKKFNDKYSHLKGSEFDAVKVILESDKTKEPIVLKDMIRECVDMVNEKLTESTMDTKEKLLMVKDKLLRMDYSADTFVSDITKCIELQNNLK